MNTSPSIDDLLAGVIQALGDEVLPALTDAKAQATAAMSQSLLQTVRQLLPVFDQCLVEEHNDMIEVLQNASAALDGVDADAARRIGELAASEGARETIPAPPDRDAVIAGHRALTTALGDVIRESVELGVNEGGNIQFGNSDPAKALSEARALAETAGVTPSSEPISFRTA